MTPVIKPKLRASQQTAALCTCFTRLSSSEVTLLVDGVVRIAAELATELATKLAELLALLFGNVGGIAAELATLPAELLALLFGNVVGIAAELAAFLAELLHISTQAMRFDEKTPSERACRQKRLRNMQESRE